MWLSDVSVKRPVMAIVLSLLLCVFGIVSFEKLSVREMPDVESPVVSIMTRYDGASATIMESQVTSVIEDQVTGVSGIDEIESVTRNGMSRITITFDLGWDLIEGVSDIRDAVANAERNLPDQADDYVHRIGRTGRAGTTGEAISLLSRDDFRSLCYIEQRLNEIIPRKVIAGFEPKKEIPPSDLTKSQSGSKPKSGSARRKPRV